ncbi:MAG: heavy metal-binding domain-containing protein [Parvularculaceae bacterium]
MDGREFDAPGRCPDCGMTLAPKDEANLGREPARLLPGAGRYAFAGVNGADIAVRYYMPPNFTAASPILLVIPGAGRDDCEDRIAWLDSSRAAGVLVAALGYPEADYDFAAYHMGGVVRNLSFRNPRVERLNDRAVVVRLRDEDIAFDVAPDRDGWLFVDFDRVFDHLVAASGSTRDRYDVFGHSAGGQILHRMAIFRPEAKADRIVAANAGFYTFPDFSRPLPSGLAGTPLTDDDLRAAFRRKLTILLGERDDNDRAGGTLLRTPLVDQQGPGRLQRGRRFHAFCAAKARELGVASAWRVKTVPGVGHDFEGMTRAAAKLMY